MVGMATRANNNHINGTGIGCGNSIEKIVNEWGQKLHRFYTADFGPMTVKQFLKIDTEGDKTRCEGSLFQNFTIRTQKAPPLRQRRLGPCSNR